LYIIAANQVWYRSLLQNLSIKAGRDFVFIDNPDDLTFAKLQQLNPRFLFFPHWSYIIPPEIYENFECVIFHMTDLPFGRGGSPLQNLISRGIYETKISALRCEKGIDSGPIYLKRPLNLYGSAEEIYIRACGIIEEMINEIVTSEPQPSIQSGEVVIFPRRTPAEGDLIQTTSLEQLFDYIRMLDAEGYPAAFFEIGDYRLEFTRASLKHGYVTADVKITKKDR
jgi:methionyl-tRNA formyltransferase